MQLKVSELFSIVSGGPWMLTWETVSVGKEESGRGREGRNYQKAIQQMNLGRHLASMTPIPMELSRSWEITLHVTCSHRQKRTKELKMTERNLEYKVLEFLTWDRTGEFRGEDRASPHYFGVTPGKKLQSFWREDSGTIVLKRRQWDNRSEEKTVRYETVNTKPCKGWSKQSIFWGHKKKIPQERKTTETIQRVCRHNAEP